MLSKLQKTGEFSSLLQSEVRVVEGRLDCNLQRDFAFQKKSRRMEKKKGNSRRLGNLQEVQTNPKYFEVFKIQMIWSFGLKLKR